jgi:glycosyltransferase involved in cell wall biosynthesis
VTVLYFADTRFPIERANGLQTMETCYALAERGHNVTLVVRPDSARMPRDPFAYYGLPRLPNFKIHSVPGGSQRHARRVRYLVSAVRMAAGRLDAVTVTRDLGLASWLLQMPRTRRPRVVYESHGHAVTVAEEMPALLGRTDRIAPPRKLARLDRREQRVWRHASAYLTLTQALADELTSRYGARSGVFVVPDAARPVTDLAPPSSSAFIAGYAGHLYPWKGVDVFIRALQHAPGVHGLIVGGHPAEGDLDRVNRLVRSLDLESRVTITGLVPPREVTSRLAPASVLVLPNIASAISERYTSPLKLFEYLHVGRPIVASNLAALREVLTDGLTALLVPPGDDRALGAALLRLKNEPVTARALASGALALAPLYTWTARAEKIERALSAAQAS